MIGWARVGRFKEPTGFLGVLTTPILPKISSGGIGLMGCGIWGRLGKNTEETEDTTAVVDLGPTETLVAAWSDVADALVP